MAGMATPLVAAQPTALEAAATKSCQGSEAIDQPIVPPARPGAPAITLKPGTKLVREWHGHLVGAALFRDQQATAGGG